ncbi:MAG: PD40 domain-containing protein [Caldilineales bacterium]|nr:PD40 domain-containing protein [Caldilineales bacterium]
MTKPSPHQSRQNETKIDQDQGVFRLWLFVVAAISLTLIFSSCNKPTDPQAAPASTTVALRVQTPSQPAISTAPAVETPAASVTPFSPTPAPSPTLALPDGLHVTVAPAEDAVGWATSLNGENHFGFPNIHAGIYQGQLYQGAIQFDLSDFPKGTKIAWAAVELVAQDAARLRPGGTWRLELLDSEIDADWPFLSFEKLNQAASDLTVGTEQRSEDLEAAKTNRFIFDVSDLAVLEQHLADGFASFRLAGPNTGGDNLFTWDSGYRNGNATENRPLLRMVILPPPTPEFVIVTSTPTPENIVTVAAQAATATAIAKTIGTFTPSPSNWVTPIVVTPQPTPANAATVDYRLAEATAAAFLYGTPTPTPFNLWTATPTIESSIQHDTGFADAEKALPTYTPTPIYIPLKGNVATPWVKATPTPAPPSMPSELIGKIAFLSNRSGGPQPLDHPVIYVIDPDDGSLAVLTGKTFYELAGDRDRYSADQRYRAFVKDALRFDGVKTPALFFYDYFYGVEGQITHFGAGDAWDPVWSPTSERIAFVSNDSSSNHIWVIDRDGSDSRQLTQNSESYQSNTVAEAYGHPSWSPDGTRIVFHSNRTGNSQIWVMNADGSNLHSLSTTSYDDWDPVWIKYIDPPRAP